jgi:hypothetical protein
MSMVGNDMGDAVAAAMVTAFPGLTLAEIKPAWEIICSAMVTYIIAHMEVKGITTLLDGLLWNIFNSGIPAAGDGGAALQTAWKNATKPLAPKIPGTDPGPYDTTKQNNDGTGRIA